MSDRDLASDTNQRVGITANSFDKFTIGLTGIKYNGEECIVDKSGGTMGRLVVRVEVIEAAIKSHSRAMLGMGILILLNTGLDKASAIGELLDKLKGLFH